MVFLWFSYGFPMISSEISCFLSLSRRQSLDPKKKQRNVATVLGRNVVIIVITIPIIKYIYT